MKGPDSYRLKDDSNTRMKDHIPDSIRTSDGQITGPKKLINN